MKHKVFLHRSKKSGKTLQQYIDFHISTILTDRFKIFRTDTPFRTALSSEAFVFCSRYS